MIILIIVLIICAALFLYIEDKWITITRYDYCNDKIPESFNNMRILHVSDLQSAYFGKNQDSLIKKAKSVKPDIIFFTGDLVDRNRTNLEASFIAAKRLQEIAQVYFVSGNHELAIEESLDPFYDRLRNQGVILLKDKGVTMEKKGENINIMGIWDSTLCQCKLGARRRDTAINPEPLENVIEELVKNVNERSFTILLSHEPQFFEHYVNDKIDLVFAGHAHGGQIRLPFTDGLFAPGQGIMPKLTSGVHKKESTSMVISRGLGNSVFPFRIFNRPELILVKLKNK